MSTPAKTEPGRKGMPHDNVLLMCPSGHEHYCGDIQVERIMRDPCCWCHQPLYRAAWWEDGDVGPRFMTATR